MSRRAIVFALAVCVRIYMNVGQTGICNARSRPRFNKHLVKPLQSALSSRLDIWDFFKRALDESLVPERRVLIQVALPLLLDFGHPPSYQ